MALAWLLQRRVISHDKRRNFGLVLRTFLTILARQSDTHYLTRVCDLFENNSLAVQLTTKTKKLN